MDPQPRVASVETGEAPTPAKPRRTRSQIGKANNRKGKDRELRVVAYLRVNGFPGAERMVRTGYRNSGRVSHDCGDITGTPGIAWQVKDIAEREWYRIPRILAETEAQAMAGNNDFGVLVIRRAGHAHPAEWWAHMYLGDMFRLVNGRALSANANPSLSAGSDICDSERWSAALLKFPIRFELGELIPLLRVAGYGTPLDGHAEVSA